MATLNEIIARAEALRKESYVNSIDPERVGSIMSDTLKYLNEFQLQSGSMGLDKIYASVSAMNSDNAPVSDLTGKPLKAGQLAVIVASGEEDEDNGKVYRFDNPGWTYVSIIGNLNIVQKTGNSETAVMSQKAVTDYLNAGYLYKGIANPSTDPGTPDQNVFYLAAQAGTYTNFNSFEVGKNEIGVFYYNTEWRVSKIYTQLPISDNDTINQYIKEIYIDFGDSGYTLADIGKINLQKADNTGKPSGTLWISLYTSGYVNLFEGYTQTDVFDRTDKGIRVIAIPYANTPFIPATYFDVELYERDIYINENPLIKLYLTEKKLNEDISEDINDEADARILGDATLDDKIQDIHNEIITPIVTDLTSQLTPVVDSQQKYIINPDGSLGEDAMLCYKTNISGQDSVTIQTRIYINSGHQSLAYAFYNSADTFDESTFISGSEVFAGGLVDQKTFTDVAVPKKAITLLVVDRGGGVLSVVATKRIIDFVRANAIRQNLGYSASKTIKYIKADGTGDYRTIQEAINDITDASITNQYELRLCNDEIYTDVTDLWLSNSPSVHNTNANPTTQIAAIVTKDWIRITGYNHRRKIGVFAPDNMAVTSQQYIQCMFLIGNVTIDNIDFEIKNGRYAIHQESGGSKTSMDYNARTIIKNSNITHLGNVHGAGYWSSCFAQANGACPGLQVEYHNVVWSPAFYMHQNANFDSPNEYLFENCRILYPANGLFDGENLGTYIGMNGSGQNSKIKFRGCDMYAISFHPGMMGGNLITDAARDIRTMIPEWNGYGNAKMMYPDFDFTGNCLAFATEANNQNISVVGGTAKDAIYGTDLLIYDGTNNAKGFCCGSEFLGHRDGDYSYTLAHRLGNCLNSPKTLILNVNGTQQTITFDENFVTLDGSPYTYQTQPAYTDSQIRTFINEQITGGSIVQYLASHRKGFPMNDCAVYGHNYRDKTIFFGAGVKRDNANPFGWVCCNVGDTPDGLACERINPNSGGLIAVIDKNYFRTPLGVSVTVDYPTGTMLKIDDADGTFARTANGDEAVLIAVAANCFEKK